MRRVCVEFLPPEELARPSVVRLLVRHGVAPMLAFPRPGDDDARLAALRPYLDAGLAACAWPLLSDGDGYWPGAGNAPAVTARIEELLFAMQKNNTRVPWIAVDLEPPLGAPRRGIAATVRAVARELAAERFSAASAVYNALQQRIAAAGIRSLAIAWPFVSADFARATATQGEAMQRLCSAPLGCGWDRIAIMTYGSLIAGYSHHLLSPAAIRWYGQRALARLSAAVGDRAGAFVGVVGRGKLGDERAYDHPEPLARDVAAARAAGASEISLFGLEGVLDAPDPEAWLRALATPAASAPFSLRGELLHRSIEAAGRTLDGAARLLAG